MKSKQKKCLLCDSSQIQTAIDVTTEMGGNRTIYECRNCSLRFIDPVPSQKELRIIYDKYYIKSNNRASTLHNRSYGWLTFRRQWQIISRLVPKKGGRILDYGCGGGHFLDNISHRWERFGIELSDDAREVATEKGINTFATLEEAAFPNEFFDIIVMFATIEHLPNPRDTVKKLRDILKTGALFVVMTGDVASHKARKRAKRWHMYRQPEHIYFFSAQSLDFLMHSLGFKKIKTLYTDGGMAQVSFWPLNIALRMSLILYETMPVLNSLPLFDHYYGYYQKR
ncbi:MAG: class I SAM-dependent methyltransferase [Chloroflexi bacterium]|nr:class I SAM-dependent methyltransferase [Chloroflexota bacterium]